jgi:hypothetical protein
LDVQTVILFKLERTHGREPFSLNTARGILRSTGETLPHSKSGVKNLDEQKKFNGKSPKFFRERFSCAVFQFAGAINWK